jgi:hypothetical protein
LARETFLLNILSRSIISSMGASYENTSPPPSSAQFLHRHFVTAEDDPGARDPDSDITDSPDDLFDHDDAVAIADANVLLLPGGAINDMLSAIRKVPSYIASRLTPEISSKLIAEFPDGTLL